MRVNSKILISHQIVVSEDELRSVWVKLSNNANAFLSWSWVKSYMSLSSNKKILLTAKVDSEIVGAGLICIRQKKYFGLFGINQWFLNRYGLEDLDQMWIENNDFLISDINKDQIRSAFLEYILSLKSVNEFVLGLTDLRIINSLYKKAQKTHIEIDSIGYRVNLRNLNSLNDYLESVSKNTRSQINRTRKLLTETAPLLLEEAKSANQKTDYFAKAGEIHLKRWCHSPQGSGFSNSHFISFHKQLLNEETKYNITKIFKLSSEDTCFGYIYILTENNTWLFYLSAINFHDDNRIKIGLLFHSMIIELAIQENIDTYDFLAGEAQYKKSLSNTEPYVQQLVHFYKPNFLLNIRDIGRSVKEKFKNWQLNANNSNKAEE